MPPPDDAATELRIAEVFLRSVGLDAASIELRVHADDAMYRHLAAMGAAPRRRLALYLREASEAAVFLDRLYRANGRSWDRTGAILDFAAGCGRVTRHLLLRVDRSRIDAADVLPETVPFLRDVLGVGAFPSHADPARVKFPRSYDLILAASLFTHLPLRTAVAWLKALRGALTPTGWLVTTTHGAAVGRARGIAVGDGVADGFAFVAANEIPRLDPDEYGSAYVSPAAFRASAAAAGFATATFVERALWDIQDAWVFAKDGSTAQPPRGVSPRGELTTFEVRPDRSFVLAGHADIDPAGPGLERIEALLDGKVGPPPTVLGCETVRTEFGDARARTRFKMDGALTPVSPGRHWTTLVAIENDGVRSCFTGAEARFDAPQERAADGALQ
jgi:hypothetical protein